MVGNHYIAEKYDLPLEIHELDLPVLHHAPKTAEMYGVPIIRFSRARFAYLEEGDVVEFGETRLEVFFTPGTFTR